MDKPTIVWACTIVGGIMLVVYVTIFLSPLETCVRERMAEGVDAQPARIMCSAPTHIPQAPLYRGPADAD
jgi:hypothetical protein